MKRNTGELQKEIKTILSGLCKETYYHSKAKDVFPYIIFELEELLQDYGRTQYRLEVNVVCRDDPAGVDALADRVADALDYESVETDKISFITYRSTRISVAEEDPRIHRRRLVFQLDFYSKEE